MLNQYDYGDNNLKFTDLFEFKGILGNGAFGIVVKAIMKTDQQEYAVKIIQKKTVGSERKYDFLKREAEILSQFDHPNIVKFVKIIETEKRMFLIMEYVKGGQLKELINERIKQSKAFTENEICIIMHSIASALHYIHSKDVIHRDLKPENILLYDKNDLTSIKICDFGLSTQYDIENQTRAFSSTCGTKIYMAPELLIKQKYSKPIDIWSYGIILYLLLSGGKHPFYEKNDTNETYIKKIKKGKWKMIDNASNLCIQFLKKLLHIDPFERYTAEQCLQHPFITRNPQDKIPLTVAERMKTFEIEENFSKLIKAISFLYCLKILDSKSNQKVNQLKSIEYPSSFNISSVNVDESSINRNNLLFPNIILRNISIQSSSPPTYDYEPITTPTKSIINNENIEEFAFSKKLQSKDNFRISYTNFAQKNLLLPIHSRKLSKERILTSKHENQQQQQQEYDNRIYSSLTKLPINNKNLMLDNYLTSISGTPNTVKNSSIKLRDINFKKSPNIKRKPNTVMNSNNNNLLEVNNQNDGWNIEKKFINHMKHSSVSVNNFMNNDMQKTMFASKKSINSLSLSTNLMPNQERDFIYSRNILRANSNIINN